MEVVHELAKSPLLAALGALVVVAVVLIPISLRVAGLSGAQIASVLKNVASVAVQLVRAFRCKDGTEPPDIQIKK